MRLLPDDTRAATAWLNYPGDRSRIEPLRPLGPNTYGEQLWPVEATYDSVTGKTRVGLSLIAPPVHLVSA